MGGTAGKALAATLLLATMAVPPVAFAQEKPTRPSQGQAKPAAKPARKPQVDAPAAASQSFPAYLQSLWPLAQARGIPRATFDSAINGLTPDPSIIALTRKQAEFVKPIWGYLSGAVNGTRITRGQAAASEWASALATAQSTHGVPREIILGIWGMETNFGSFKGNMDVIRSLATLAHLKYRDGFFQGELLVALEILAKGLAERSEMRGSWAGAMGHTQFMPTSYMQYAIDQSGDGHADIWDNVPDALGSTGNYLKGHGWQAGLPWGMEVEVPEGLDFTTVKRSFAAWSGAGLKRSDGAALPSSGEATLYLPAGITGPAFLVTANYDVIKKYNNSDAYALAVAHLGDRIMGRSPIQGDWPTDEPQLSKGQREEVQRRLKALGHYNDKIDGRLGSGTREAVRRFQIANRMVADGYANLALLARLKAARP